MKNKTEIHKNNFDFIRIFAALVVLYSHHYSLTGKLEPGFLSISSLGGVAVYIFFSVSGYLVTSSWYNDPNLIRFSIKRFLRIWPAFTLLILTSAFLYGPLLSSLSLKEYFSHENTYFYLRWLWLMDSYYLPGLFENNLLKNVVNGSIWTIPFEVKCYIVLAFLGFFRVLKNKKVYLTFISLYLFWFFIKINPDITKEVDYLTLLSSYFFIGSFLYLFKEFWMDKKIIFICLSFIFSFLLQKIGFYHSSGLILIPITIILFGVSSTPIINNFGKYGDPSYGIYLYAFPIQQIFIMKMLPEVNFNLSIFFSYVCTLLVAYFSWHVVEKRALMIKPKRN